MTWQGSIFPECRYYHVVLSHNPHQGARQQLHCQATSKASSSTPATKLRADLPAAFGQTPNGQSLLRSQEALHDQIEAYRNADSKAQPYIPYKAGLYPRNFSRSTKPTRCSHWYTSHTRLQDQPKMRCVL